MQNGHYKIQHKMLGTIYHLSAHAGTYRLTNTSGRHIKIYTSDRAILEHCNVLEKLPTSQKRYDIAYYISGQVKEVIKIGASWAVCQSKINALKTSSHKCGLLRPINCT